MDWRGGRTGAVVFGFAGKLGGGTASGSCDVSGFYFAGTVARLQNIDVVQCLPHEQFCGRCAVERV
jgi:hypothetical protein